MTKKRFLVVSVLLLALLAIGLGVAALISPASGFSEANFNRAIKTGATRADVEAILGPPTHFHYSRGEDSDDMATVCGWDGRWNGYGEIGYGEDGRIRSSSLMTYPTFMDWVGIRFPW